MAGGTKRCGHCSHGRVSVDELCSACAGECEVCAECGVAPYGRDGACDCGALVVEPHPMLAIASAECVECLSGVAWFADEPSFCSCAAGRALVMRVRAA